MGRQRVQSLQESGRQRVRSLQEGEQGVGDSPTSQSPFNCRNGRAIARCTGTSRYSANSPASSLVDASSDFCENQSSGSME